jgi:hypothetical protein
MRSFGLLGGLVVLLLLFSGCPYESKTPLSKPDRYSVDSKLVGLWFGSSDSVQVLIAPFNANEYYIELSEEGDDEVARIRAFVFEIAGKQFFHFNEISLDGTPKPFSLARFALSEDNQLSIRIVEDKIIPESLQTKPKELIEFIGSHMNDPKLYDIEIFLQRVEPE